MFGASLGLDIKLPVNDQRRRAYLQKSPAQDVYVPTLDDIPRAGAGRSGSICWMDSLQHPILVLGLNTGAA